jgi:hypothetical protein
MPGHKIKDIIMTADNKVQEIRLEDGRALDDWGAVKLQLHGDGKKIRLQVLVEGNFLINGEEPLKAFKKANEEKPRIQVPGCERKSLIVGPNNQPLVIKDMH